MRFRGLSWGLSFLPHFRVFVFVFVFFRDGENIENFRFDIFLAITQEPNHKMEVLIKYVNFLTDFT